jgi:UDP-N-acetylmuramoyl-tripeptide--D-alanyl-D-alanine ligase
MKLRLHRIAGYIGAAGEFNGELTALGYSIDSRTVEPGELFFAVRGERLDGHEFVDAALEKGAVAAVVCRHQAARYGRQHKLLLVEDPLRALQLLAAGVRVAWGRPLIAITGSAGKTTTKETLARILATRYNLLKSEGNLNNHFGLPLQLLRLGPEHEIAVVELGMSHAGEITRLAEIARPEVGVVTNVAPVHLGFFKSVAEIARAKRELIGALPPDGIAVLNADDEYVSRFGADFPGRLVTFGMNRPADVRAEAVEPRGVLGSKFDLVVGSRRERVEFPLIGQHNIYNALAATAAALQFELDVSEAAAALENVTAADKRGQVLQLSGATVINDCYNSNPRALDAMVDALAGMTPGPKGRRILVAGEMLELGPAAEELHRRCGEHAARRKLDVVLGVRGAARFIVQGAHDAGAEAMGANRTHAEYLESPELAGEWLRREVRAGDIVLLKASRGVRLERSLELWQSRLETGPRTTSLA